MGFPVDSQVLLTGDSHSIGRSCKDGAFYLLRRVVRIISVALKNFAPKRGGNEKTSSTHHYRVPPFSELPLQDLRPRTADHKPATAAQPGETQGGQK